MKNIEAIINIVMGILLFLGAAWFLIFKFHIFQAPGLIRYFPKAYILMFGLLIGGIIVFIRGLIKLKN